MYFCLFAMQSVIYLAPSIPQGVTYDKFLKASIQGDYLNYQGIQKMENFYLSAPKNIEVEFFYSNISCSVSDSHV